jgi:hypothetical protein
MAHGRLIFVMPARCDAAFEAFFNHDVRLRWDTLLRVNYVEGGVVIDKPAPGADLRKRIF